MKQLSRGLHGINRVSFLFFVLFFLMETQRNPRQNKGKNQKMKCSSFCIQDNLFCCWCLLLCCFLLFFLSFLWWITRHLVTQHVYHAFACKNTQTRTATSTSVASEIHRKCLSAFFRRLPKPVLDKCEGEIRHRRYCLC